MRAATLASALLLAACSSAAPRAAPPPTASGPAVTDVALTPSGGQQACPDTARFAAALEHATDRTPNDPQVVGWNYSPWCTGSLILYGVHERVELFLGGLVKLDDGNGQQRVRILELAN